MNPESPDDLRDRFAGALLGTAVGDVLGMPVENWSAEKIAASFGRLDHFRTAALWLRGYAVIYGSLLDPLHTIGRAPLGRGTYTDDTQMTIAVAESLVQRRGFDGEDMARRFVEHFDPRRGYGPGTIKAIRALQRGAPWDKIGPSLFNGTGSFGNGAAMRTAPIALLHHADRQGMRDITRRAAAITHAHPLGIEGAVIQSTAIRLALDASAADRPVRPDSFLNSLIDEAGLLREPFQRKLESVRDLLTAEPTVRQVVDELGNNTTAQGSVPAAIYAFLRHSDSFKEAVVYAVNLGGDTDTIGAMTGAIAGAYHGERGIPLDWIDALEEGPRGKTYIRSLGHQLFDLMAAKSGPQLGNSPPAGCD